MTQFVVYRHATTSGRIFYIGKGTEKRARDLAPSRRTRWHLNLVRKYRDELVIEVHPCGSEAEAFDLERRWIAEARAQGHRLANLTDGGEGAAGRIKSAFEVERIREAVRRSWDKRGRKPKIKTPLPVRPLTCACGVVFTATNPRAASCSKACDQRRRRNAEKRPTVRAYANNKTGRTGIYQWSNGRWHASIGICGRTLYLGTFDTKAQAADARQAAELKYAEQWRGGKGARGPRTPNP